MEQQEKNEWAQQEQEIQEGLKGKSFWYADWGFPILVGIMSAAIFAGTHMYVVSVSYTHLTLPTICSV